MFNVDGVSFVYFKRKEEGTINETRIFENLATYGTNSLVTSKKLFL